MFAKLLSAAIVSGVVGFSLGRRQGRRSRKAASVSFQSAGRDEVTSNSEPVEHSTPFDNRRTLLMLALNVWTVLLVFLSSFVVAHNPSESATLVSRILVAVFSTLFCTLTTVLLKKQDVCSSTQDSSPSHVAVFSGVWVKDAAASTSADAVMDIMCVGPLVRRAVALVYGLEIKQTESSFHLSVVSIFRFLKVALDDILVSELYSMNGAVSQWKRRDLRRGVHNGKVQWNAEKQSLSLWLEWGEPHRGKGVDVFELPEANTLRVISTLYAPDGRTASYVTIYRRRCKQE